MPLKRPPAREQVICVPNGGAEGSLGNTPKIKNEEMQLKSGQVFPLCAVQRDFLLICTFSLGCLRAELLCPCADRSIRRERTNSYASLLVLWRSVRNETHKILFGICCCMCWGWWHAEESPDNDTKVTEILGKKGYNFDSQEKCSLARCGKRRWKCWSLI